jgi:uncharacterized protein
MVDQASAAGDNQAAKQAELEGAYDCIIVGAGAFGAIVYRWHLDPMFRCTSSNIQRPRNSKILNAKRDWQIRSYLGGGLMRIVSLEEHFLIPSLVESIDSSALNVGWMTPELRDGLTDLGERRLQAMNESGITVQVLSATMPGADLLDGEEGIRFAKATNDRLAEAVRQRPLRFAGFAHLPMRKPEAAADELDRAVSRLGFRGVMINGTTEGRFLDDPCYAPVLARAAKLDVPVYIHPNLAPKPVFDSYYAGLPGNTGALLGSGVFGWHAEVAIHVFRLALSGSFEQHPGLTVIVGHMGEMLPFMLDRADQVLLGHGGLKTPISEIILDRVYVTTSGFFTISPFLNALTSFGADRILFSVDYPFSSAIPARRWLDNVPVSRADKIKIMHGNADRLLKLDQLA